MSQSSFFVISDSFAHNTDDTIIGLFSSHDSAMENMAKIGYAVHSRDSLIWVPEELVDTPEGDLESWYTLTEVKLNEVSRKIFVVTQDREAPDMGGASLDIVVAAIKNKDRLLKFMEERGFEQCQKNKDLWASPSDLARENFLDMWYELPHLIVQQKELL